MKGTRSCYIPGSIFDPNLNSVNSKSLVKQAGLFGAQITLALFGDFTNHSNLGQLDHFGVLSLTSHSNGVSTMLHVDIILAKSKSAIWVLFS